VTTVAKHETTSAPFAVFLETRVGGVATENANAIGLESSIGSTLRWGSWQAYDGTVVDRLDARYYNNNFGRFWSVDPARGVMADPANPQSWNLYTYTNGDPINFRDVSGQCTTSVSDEDEDPDPCMPGLDNDPGPIHMCNQISGRMAALCGGGNHGGGAKNPLIDSASDSLARGLLQNLFKNFKGSHCDSVFNDVIDGYSTADFEGEAGQTEFYNVTQSQYGNLTQNQVTGNGSSTTLAGTFQGQSQDATAITIGGASQNPAVLLSADFFMGNSTVFQPNVLLHELLHAYTGWSDSQVFTFFQDYGLKDVGESSEAISAWMSTGCQSTPTSPTWYDK
jgi:RHS repeat-associated protein